MNGPYLWKGYQPEVKNLKIKTKPQQKTQHNFTEMNEVVVSRSVGRCEESLRWQYIGNHAQAQLEWSSKTSIH